MVTVMVPSCRTRWGVVAGLPPVWQMVTELGLDARFDCLAVLTPASDSEPVPGQGKRKQRLAARTAPDVGRWEVVFETRDRAELRAHLRRLQEARIDGSVIRTDTLCGRLAHETTYWLSRFVADPASESSPEHSDH
ncbi:hypothetical protein ACH4TC_27870 [Streptomyces spororaveus]|uniref:hypothetical protein n=1 Tax=Streptomyces spororaveus TaxID=284039 RepID=UPI0037B1821F